MRKNSIILFLLIILPVNAQNKEKHFINADLDFSFGWHYTKTEINNPWTIGGNFGYEYKIQNYLGIEVGFKALGYKQEIGYKYGELNTLKELYNGIYIAPFITPKLYLAIGYDEKTNRAKNIFIKTRLSYGKKITNIDRIDSNNKNQEWKFVYEIQAGYQYLILNNWNISAWIGYNSFDYGPINNSEIKLKTSTPIQLGIGLNYTMNYK